MQPVSAPIVLGSRQSVYGYWIVTISMQPGLRTEVMCAKLGLTSKDAEQLAQQALPRVPDRWRAR